MRTLSHLDESSMNPAGAPTQRVYMDPGRKDATRSAECLGYLLVRPPGCILHSGCEHTPKEDGLPPMSVVYGILVVCGACLAAVIGLSLVQRLVPVNIRQEHNDVAGFVYAVLGVIYAVLLALVVIAVWEEFGRARVTVEAEANALAEIFWLAHELPEPEGRQLQELARAYAEEAVDNEWPLMQQGRAPLMEHTQETPAGWVLIDDIRATLQGFEPRTEADQELYARRARPGPAAGRR